MKVCRQFFEMRPTQCCLNKDASWKHMEKLPYGQYVKPRLDVACSATMPLEAGSPRRQLQASWKCKWRPLQKITSRSWCVLIWHPRFESVLKSNRQVLRPCVLSWFWHGNSWVSWVLCHHNWSLDGHWNRHWEWHEQLNEFNAVSNMKGYAETSISKLVMSTKLCLSLPPLLISLPLRTDVSPWNPRLLQIHSLISGPTRSCASVSCQHQQWKHAKR